MNTGQQAKCIPSLRRISTKSDIKYEKIIKENKENVNLLITSFEIRSFEIMRGYNIWGREFQIGNESEDTFVFCADFCDHCGNYKYDTVRIPDSHPPSIFCNCVNHENLVDEEDVAETDQRYWENHASKWGGYFV